MPIDLPNPGEGRYCKSCYGLFVDYSKKTGSSENCPFCGSVHSSPYDGHEDLLQTPSAVSLDGLDQLANYAGLSPVDGCFVEVGVYKGGSAEVLVKEAGDRPVFLYDTFSGIPHQGWDDDIVVGTYADTSKDEIESLFKDRSNVEVIEGLFPESLIDMPPIAMAHIDCDQYQSIMDCCKTLWPLMLPGGWMRFDDYGVFRGATRAVDEYFGQGAAAMRK